MTSIEHVTITTGAARRSDRREVSSEVIDKVRESIANHGGKLWDTGWSVALLRSPEGGHVYDLAHEGKAIVSCWLCVDDAVSDDMWRAVSSGAPPKIKLSKPDRAPWLAVSLLPDAVEIALRAPAVLMEAADLERCVAWALIE